MVVKIFFLYGSEIIVTALTITGQTDSNSYNGKALVCGVVPPDAIVDSNGTHSFFRQKREANQDLN